MKIPLTPPKLKLGDKDYPKLLAASLMQPQGVMRPANDKGEYLHWDKIRHLHPPLGLSPEQWWFAIKIARISLYKSLPFVSTSNKSFVFATPDVVLQKLTMIDRKIGNNTTYNQTPLLNPQIRDSYLIQSLIEEAITSSQLEGASTTRAAAKEMLRTQRKPRTLSEKMIFNNYKAMQFIQEIQAEPLTIDIILEIHRILSNDISEQNPGYLRKNEDDIKVFDNRDGTILHIPPNAEELKQRLQKLCQFANTTTDQMGFYIHPVIKAIILHFMLAYDHPFVDGNGRTARALFYWSMLHEGYNLIEFVSISQILKNSPMEYARAYLYTETDENDLTYFIIHQLNTIIKAIDKLYNYLDKSSHELQEIEQLLTQVLQNELNYRQIMLIKHALKHPNMQYKIAGHRLSHNVTYDTARNDLLNLAKLGLLLKKQIGKAFVFVSPADLKKRIEKFKK